MGRRRFHADGAHAVVSVQGRPVVLRWREARAGRIRPRSVGSVGPYRSAGRRASGSASRTGPHVMGRAGFTP